VILCLAFFVWANFAPHWGAWLLILPGLLFLKPLSDSIRQRFTKITIGGDKLCYETGMLSKTTRTIQLSRVQDVKVEQTLLQRLVGIGDLSIETAGETSQLTMRNIDDPGGVADEIIGAAQKQADTRKREAPAAKRKGERG
jgi:putative membrane protein